MILHLVTDRLRIAAAGGTEADARRCLLQQLDYAVAAGIDVVQIRERNLEGRALAALVRDAVARARGTRTRIVVNERVDVAIACGAAGVHLRADSMSALVVREIAPAGFLIGRSVHGVAEALEAAAGADYLIAGTVWPSKSKPEDHSLLGSGGLAAVAAAVDLPVLAIGGVTPAHAEEVSGAGAAGMAGIGLFMAADHAECRAVPLREVAAALRSSI